MLIEIQCCIKSTNQHAQGPSPAPESSGLLKKYPELYLDPGSCGGNTPSTDPKSLVPG